MDTRDIRAADLSARAKFTYLPDPPGRDTWRSHADDVLAGRPWQGDCDDLASTVLDLMFREGELLANLYRLRVSSQGTETVDHMIACTWDYRGTAWIVGDTFGEAYPAKVCRHRALSYQSLDDLSTWREGAPWD